MEGEDKVLFGSVPGPWGPQDLVFTTHQGLWGEGHPLIPPPTLISATATLTAPTWRGEGGGDTRSGVMGLSSGTTPPDQGQPHAVQRG